MLATEGPPAGRGLPESLFAQLRLIADSLPILIAHCDARSRTCSSIGHTPRASGSGRTT